MAIARKDLVDPSWTPFYHCISGCVRQGFHCATNGGWRRDWLRNRLRKLTQAFAIEACAFAFMSNHFHLIVMLCATRLKSWSDREVVRRWARVHPPRDSTGKRIKITDKWLNEQAKDKERVEELRERLGNLGWFMKDLKEPLARMANQEDGVRGHFWDGRYKSIAILDEPSLIAVSGYVDLNPFSAFEVQFPESSIHASLMHRIEHYEKMVIDEGAPKLDPSAIPSKAEFEIEERHWLCPIFNVGSDDDGHREGMMPGMSLAKYVTVVELMSRLVRGLGRQVNRTTETILERLNLPLDCLESWVMSFARNERGRGIWGGAIGDKEQLRKHAEARRKKRQLMLM